MRGSYLGPKFSNNFIEDKLKSVNAVFKKIDNEDELLSEISRKLNEQKQLDGFKEEWSSVQEL